ncbi:hypothetical protein DWB61_17285 [Ancylomarina euxinus]|uniref:Uncharacterized protein n=1 Tax=Ancylomarina euxinus TaxID=2283627 RepID=A0A425XWI8_9BACT|nr:hypothetical protein [Ancylomarina euxinus]MCZ4696409.1 hypothetical protein [Ancylomarina euxinus]RRG19012.1 hypothetical protein DWB61_17285 [Ancylomarina euxinus]
MKKLLILISFILTGFLSFSQALVLNYSLENNNKTLNFPEFISLEGDNEAALEAINEYIQLQTLNKKISKSDKYLFEDFTKERTCDYELYKNSKTILSLKIDAGYSHYLNFNSQTGRIIELSHLFKENSIHELYNLRKEVLEKRIEFKLSKIVDSQAKEELRKSLYERLDKYFQNFFIKDNSLCLFSSQGQDIRHENNINWTVSFQFSEIENMLSEYGKAIFLGNTNIKEEKFETSKAIFLKGFIADRYPITMVLNFSYDNKFRYYEIDESYYWYDKVGQGLYLVGSRDTENKYNVEMFDLGSRTIKEKFEFEFDGKKYEGVWKDLTSGKELKFTAKSYFE